MKSGMMDRMAYRAIAAAWIGIAVNLIIVKLSNKTSSRGQNQPDTE